MAKTQGLGLRAFRPRLISIAVASCFVTSTALANPTGPTVAHGTANIQQIGNLLKVTNSPSAIINWQSFSIGANEITRFIQQSQASAVLNRVTGNAGVIDPSVILGALQSNGRVFLINPSGILFGAGAQIDVAGLVASSLNLSNENFLANRMLFTDGVGAGSIANQGNITTGAGGNVYLVGSAVTNNGIITSPQGEVVLAAGKSVELVDAGTPSLRVEITAPDNQAINLGTIVADAGRVGIYAGLISNSGTIRASSAVAEGGKILLKATKEVTLESTSILDASGVGGGRIDVLSKNGGTVNVNGRLDASAPNGGDGGFIETSADTVRVADGTVITTMAPQGKTGLWLLDPVGGDFFISAYGGDISGATLSSALDSNNVTKTNQNGSGGYGGSIFVDDTVNWNSGHSLTLLAEQNVSVNQSITNAGTGGINLYAGWDGGSTTTPVVTPNVGSIQVAAPLWTGGDVILIAGQHAHQMETFLGSGVSLGVITAVGLLAVSGGTSSNFNYANNSVNTVAGKGIQGFHFKNDRRLTIGTVGGVSGITVTAPGSLPASIDIEVAGASGPADLNVDSNLSVTAGAGYGGNINLNVGGSFGGAINVTNANLVASGADSSGGGLDSSIDLSATAVNITNSTLEANGTLAAFGGGSGQIEVNGTNGVTITGSILRARGGNGGESGGDAQVYISSGSGTLAITGGSTIEALGGTGGAGFNGGDAEVTLSSSSPQTINVTGSTLRAIAGGGDFTGEGTVRIEDGASDIIITNSTIQADGAEGGISIEAAGNVTIKGGSTLSANGASGPEGFHGEIEVEGSTVTIEGSTLRSKGGSGSSSSGGDGAIDIYAYGTGGVNITGGSILEAIGGAGAAPDQQGNAEIWIGTGLSGGNIAIGSSTINANGQNAGLWVQSDTNITANGSALAATGRTGADGGEGLVLFGANGTINTGSSTVSAVGRTSADGGEGISSVIFFAGGDITLGLLSSNELVAVNSGGSIIDGNAGANVSAPIAGLSGSTGVGSLANPLETVATNLFLSAYGGEIGVINSGNLVLAGLSNNGAGANAVGTTGTMLFAQEIHVSGDLTLAANNGMVVEQGISSGGNLVLSGGAGDLGFNGVSVQGSNVTLSGNNVLVGFTTSTAPTAVSASQLMKVTTAGNLNVLGGANSGANAFLGGQDVELVVGTTSGFVNIAGGGAGATAQIHSSLPTTIKLHFPTLGAGGYFVNGTEGAITDGDTGFFANGEPAILDENLLITYGLTELPPAVQQAIDQVIASTNQQTDKEPETTNSDDPDATEGDKDKKDLAVCK